MYYTFCVLKHLGNDADFAFEDFDVFLTKNELVSVHEPESNIVEKTGVRVGQSKASDAGRIFYLMLGTIVDEYSPVLDRIADETLEIEALVLEHPEPRVLSRIFKLKRNLIEFRPLSDCVTFSPLRDAGMNLVNEFWPDVRKKLFRRYLRPAPPARTPKEYARLHL